MDRKTNYIKELSLRVYNKIGKQQLDELLTDGKPLMTHDELTRHINDNFGEYLNTEEQEQLIIQNIYHVDNEEIKSLMLKLAIEMAATYVKNAFENALSEKDFVGDDPYSALTAPRMFILYKFYDEQMGIKLDSNSLDELLEY